MSSPQGRKRTVSTRKTEVVANPVTGQSDDDSWARISISRSTPEGDSTREVSRNGAGRVKREASNNSDGDDRSINSPRVTAETENPDESTHVSVKRKNERARECQRQDIASTAATTSPLLDGEIGRAVGIEEPAFAAMDPMVAVPPPAANFSENGLSPRRTDRSPPPSVRTNHSRVESAPLPPQATVDPSARAASGRVDMQTPATTTEVLAFPSTAALPPTPVAPSTSVNSGKRSSPRLSRTNTCVHPGCPIRPSYGHRGDGKVTRCAGHKEDGMTDVVSKRCVHPNCDRIPSFRHDGKRLPMFCAAHKEPGMKDYHKQTRRCMHQSGCTRTPSFGFEGCKRTACAQHRVEGMVNRNTKCGTDGCRLVPAFAFQGEPPSFCSKHKTEGMINVVSRRCEHASCDRIPSYGREEDGKKPKASFCKEHKSDDMVNVKHPRCKEPECRRQPGFGPAGGKTAVFCKEHSTPGMVDVKNNYQRKKARLGT